ncbi:MAG: CD3337/EF1877 family mobilome membrane protein [Waltera sp.]|jgi:hypothetical protein|uniref:CD3337/EF1877 family mobilome membrane protein n=1 Tax=Waltera sp. TaxID=2815806 RepID=UPI00399B9A6D
MKYKIKYILCMIAFVVGLMLPVQPVAASSSAIGEVQEFNNLSGNAKYLGSAYRDNYSLDIEEVEISDGIGEYLAGKTMEGLNALAKVFFFLERLLAYLTVVVFYVSFNLNLVDLFGSQVSVIQQALNDSIFQPLFLMGCAAAFCVLIGRMLRQDLAGALGQIVKVIAIVMMSILVVTKSDTMLSMCNNITKEISLEILVGVNSANGYSDNINAFSGEAAGILWNNMVHQPWLTMEFGYTASDDQVLGLLSYKPGAEERKDAIAADESGSFLVERATERLGFSFLYLIPCIMKCGIYIIIVLIQLVFQLLSIVYLFMAPLVLIVSLFPGYDGLIGGWLRKILETQISILVLSLIIGILIKFDELIFDWSRSVGFGWMIALTIQIAIAIALFLNRNKLLMAMSTVQRGVSNPRYLRNRMRLAGNVYANAPRAAKEIKSAAKWTASKAVSAGEGVSSWVQDKNVPVSWTVNPFLKNQKIKAQEETPPKATQRKVKKKSVAGSIMESVDMAPKSSDVGQQKASSEKPYTQTQEEKGGSESIRMISEDLVRNLNQLAMVVDAVGDNLHDNIRDNGAVERPILGDKKEEDRKELTINVKTPDGSEQSVHAGMQHQQMEAQIPLHRSEYDAEEIKSRELKEPTQQARPTMQAVRNDEKNDIVHNREADVQAVQPAAIEQTDKEVKEKTNRHTEKRLLQKERDTEREKFVRKE